MAGLQDLQDEVSTTIMTTGTLNGAVRVLHLPARTTYARKLNSSEILMVNGKTMPDGLSVPIDASFDWVDARETLDFFDVLHIHSVEFAPTALVTRVLEKCARYGRRVIFTLHDITPMFDDPEDTYAEKLKTVCTAADSVVTLTDSAAQALRQRAAWLELDKRVTVVPHGYVVEPQHHAWGQAGSHNGRVEYAMYGAFRPNRDCYVSVVNWYYGLQDQNARLNILCRAFNEVDLRDEKLGLRYLLDFVHQRADRIRLVVHPFPSDEQVIRFLTECNVLLMPYRWGTHSGQLEIAFDLNLLPVISDVGYYEEQWQVNRRFVNEPVWIRWADGNPYVRAARLIESLRQAQEIAKHGPASSLRDEYRNHRMREHEEFLRTHQQLYTRSGHSEYHPR
jgi:glycosyltransferase involved in cell wall biosynthesis